MIAPEFKVELYKPNCFGMITQFGSAEDFRFDDISKWELRNCELIPELNCLTFKGDSSPKSMENIFALTGRNSDVNWVVRYPDYTNPVYSWQFCDAKIYDPDTDDPEDYIGIISSSGFDDAAGNFALTVRRNNPPRGQLIDSLTFATIPDIRYDDLTNTYVPGWLSLCLPVGDSKQSSDYEYTNPFLHHIDLTEAAGGIYDVFTEGIILAEIPINNLEAGSRERWTFEHVTDPNYFDGSHILIKSQKIENKKGKLNDNSGYTHIYDERITVANKTLWDALGLTYAATDEEWRVSCQGCVQTVNLSKINYSQKTLGKAFYKTGRLWRGPEHYLESATYLSAGARWTDLTTQPTGTSVWVDNYTGWESAIRPEVSLQHSGTKTDVRPFCWYITETNKAIIGNVEDTLYAWTEGLQTVTDLQWTWGEDYKNSTGSVGWQPTNIGSNPLPTPVDGARVEITAGWDAAAPAAVQKPLIPNIFGWTDPAANPNRRSGGTDYIHMVDSKLNISSYDSAKLSSKKSQMIDFKQAGGMTVDAWAKYIGNRLGIPEARIYVDAAVATKNIKVNEVPSKPSLEASDGTDILSHIQSVEDSTDIRVCWDKTNDFTIYVDAGKPHWTGNINDIKFILDEDTVNIYEIVLDVDSTFDTSNYKNFLKFKIGRHGKEEFGYLYDLLPTRSLNDLDDFQVYIEEADATTVNEVIYNYFKRHRPDGLNYGLKLKFSTMMRPDLRPDDFILISKLNGITQDESIPGIFQILTHTITINAEELEGISEFTVAYVNTYTEEPMKGINSSVFN